MNRILTAGEMTRRAALQRTLLGAGGLMWGGALAPQARAADDLVRCLTGGDDSELLMAIAPAQAASFRAHADWLGIAVTRIGRLTPGPPDVTVIGPDGAAMALGAGGWSHFA